ncbi:MAG: C-terminal helicase domain-containing protein [Flavobacteriales bacterium]|nr:C-terminal helicase domain-containing protein [Flavobacteriales bacterium]
MSRGEDKMGRLLRIIEHVEGSGIIYLRERKGTVRISQFLQDKGISAAAYHAGMSFQDRDKVQQQWSNGEVRFVAATNAFGMGIDKADVRCVIHLEPPPDLESYYQEAGRAGRDGQASFAFLLVDDGDESRMREKFAASFPSISEVRRTYQAFADMHHIALGSGQFESYDLDLRAIATRTSINVSTVSHCLKALELDGSLTLSDGARTPSRVGMRASDRTIYDIRVKAPRMGPMLEALLRMHGGLFEEPAIIDEGRLAKHMGCSVGNVIGLLKELDRQHTIFYKPRNDSPTATLLTPRRDALLLMLNKEALDNRQARSRARMEAMIDFTFHSAICRERSLLRYFSDAASADCKRCDVCKQRARSSALDPNAKGLRIAPVPEDIELLRWRSSERPAPADRMIRDGNT